LLDYLHDVIGVPDENVVFLVALGTPREQTEEELRRLTPTRCTTG
jgi:nickel-dependent lactate racemase